MTHQTSRLAKWSLIIGIVIVINMFFNYAISLVYKAPQYPMTVQPQVVGTIYTQESCVSIGGQWTEQAPVVAPYDKTKTISGYCDPDYSARIQYDQDRRDYERSVFIILVILGILTLMGGVLISHEVLAPAFAWGGVLSLLIASMRYWSEADNLLKVGILAIALVALVVVAVRKFDK